MTKIPAPMMAPIPSVTRLTGPSARLRLCSPLSFASANSVLTGFFANNGLLMRLPPLFSAVCLCLPDSIPLIRIAKLRLMRDLACLASTAGPQPIHRNANQHDDEADQRGLRLVQKQNRADECRGQNVQCGNDRIPEGLVRPFGIWAFLPQHKDSRDGQRVKNQDGEDDVVQKIVVQIPEAAVRIAGTRQDENGDPDPLKE